MLKKFSIMLIAGLIALFMMPAAAFASFDDVPTDHWAYDAIDYLAEEGLVIGYPDGTYRGDRQLTRYEFAMVISRLYDQFLDMLDDVYMGEPPIEMEAVLDMLLDEFQPEIDELRELINSNTMRIEELEGTVGGFDERITGIADMVDEMDRRFHPYGDLTLRFYGYYPESGLEPQRAQFMLRFGFTSQITDELTLNARLNSGNIGGRQSAYQTYEDAFGFDSIVIDQAAMIWRPEDYPGFTLYGGKFSPPWVTSPMVWDGDITVEGLAQHYNWGDFNFYLGELIPAEEGFYFIAQAGIDDLLIDGTRLAVTYHYINSEAWGHLMDSMACGDLTCNSDYSRLESPDDYRAIEAYWHWTSEALNIPFMLKANFLMNLEDTAPGLEDEAGWQQAAWASLAFNDLTLREVGDWNVWGEWGRVQPNSALSWLTDAWRGACDAEFWLVGWKYRLLDSTDLTVAYMHRERLSSMIENESALVSITTRFK